ncbi:hypothetical protein [Streptomyces yaizuensis]|uniref:Flp pilus assembly protein RcpC/CpaB domain-containing protein n=1 Tax=Streptomyces yaizuensis TaxID=2989713 RepID=A0ABQ5PA68_9ACTN|nr:hypothetical protein [Streptomyces sp. YSPA8]GLF99489.1 hypothetical protein SYYSPA8_34350 [Streptomyces sp. YSPA8]
MFLPEALVVPGAARGRVRGRHAARRLKRAVRRRRRALAAGLALTAAALTASGPRAGQDRGGGDLRDRAAGAGEGPMASAPTATTTGTGRSFRAAAGARTVTVPVRIADAETVRLLRPGDRVDVIAAPDPAPGVPEPPAARVVAACVRVASAPRALAAEAGGGALVPISVPRRLAPALAAAGVTARLAVTVC